MSITSYITAHNSQFLSKSVTGLGNVLFQVSISYALAKKTGRDFSAAKLQAFCEKLRAVYAFPHGDTIFRHVLALSKSEEHVISRLEIREPPNCNRTYVDTIETTIRSLPFETPIQLYGYFESLRYFQDYADEVRGFFSPSIDDVSMILSKYPSLQSEKAVSIHFRSPPGHSFESAVTDRDYYKRAIAYFAERHTNPHFFIFKDDDSSIDLTLFEGFEVTFVHNEFDFLDLWAMSLIPNHILSYSTFNFWGAFLSRSVNVIANKRLGFQLFKDAGYIEI